MRALRSGGWLALALAAGACARRDTAPPNAQAADSAAARSIARDRAERLVMSLAPEGAGEMVVQAVAESRAALGPLAAAPEVEPVLPALDLPLPSADAGSVPEPEAVATAERDMPQLKPPIARGAARLPSGGRGGRVTLDVRVDEAGAVSDVLFVETDADSLTVRAATAAAFSASYHPALLGTRRVAVWTRQVFEVKRGRGTQ